MGDGFEVRIEQFKVRFDAEFYSRIRKQSARPGIFKFITDL